MVKGKWIRLIRQIGTYVLYVTTAAAVFAFPRIVEAHATPSEPKTMTSNENSTKGEFTVYAINKNGITKLTPVLNEEVKVDENGDGVYEVPSDSTVIFKHADGDAAVWSATPIEDQDQFRTNYLATGTDPSIKDDTVFHYYSGDGTFNWKADIGNQWSEASTFTTSGGTTTIYIPVGKLSHLNYLTSSTPTLPVGTPTPSDPGNTPTPSYPGNTPTPSDPGNTPTPTTTSYPKTGYNDKNMSVMKRINVMAKTMSKEEKKAITQGLFVFGIGSLAAGGYAIYQRAKTKKKKYNHK